MYMSVWELLDFKFLKSNSKIESILNFQEKYCHTDIKHHASCKKSALKIIQSP